MKKSQEVLEVYNNFDFSTLDWGPHDNCVFWLNYEKEFCAYNDDGDTSWLHIFARQQDAVYIGRLEKWEADLGHKPVFDLTCSENLKRYLQHNFGEII